MAEPAKTELIRGLSVTDAILITVGSVLGTGAFLTTADVARALPHAGLVLVAWVCGGLLTVAGALTYGELGAMMPRAGEETGMASAVSGDRVPAGARGVRADLARLRGELRARAAHRVALWLRHTPARTSRLRLLATRRRPAFVADFSWFLGT